MVKWFKQVAAKFFGYKVYVSWEGECFVHWALSRSDVLEWMSCYNVACTVTAVDYSVLTNGERSFMRYIG